MDNDDGLKGRGSKATMTRQVCACLSDQCAQIGQNRGNRTGASVYVHGRARTCYRPFGVRTVRTLPKMGSRLDIDHGAMRHRPPFTMARLSSCEPRVFAALRGGKIFCSTEPSSRNVVEKIRCAEAVAMPVTSSRPSQPSEPQGLRDCVGRVSLRSVMARVTETSGTSCPLPYTRLISDTQLHWFKILWGGNTSST